MYCANISILHEVVETDLFDSFYVIVDRNLQNMDIRSIDGKDWIFIDVEYNDLSTSLVRPHIFGDVYSVIIKEVVTSRRTDEILSITYRTKYFATNINIRVMNADGTCNNYCYN